jgi:hypothetical protein
MTQRYTKVAHNSKNSYEQLVNSGKYARYKDAIIQELQKKPRTRRELVSLVHAGNPSNLTAPLKALENEGIICRMGVVFDPVTKREVTQYGISVTQDDQGSPEMSCISMYISGTISSSTETPGTYNDKIQGI